MGATLLQWVAATLFATAILHTFATSRFERLARQHPAHAGLWHLLGEVEVVFGFWACVLVAALFLLEGMPGAVRYMDSRNFTEPLFVFAIMVIAGTHPILQASRSLVQWLSRLLPSCWAKTFSRRECPAGYAMPSWVSCSSTSPLAAPSRHSPHRRS